MTDYHGHPIDFDRRSKDPAAWFMVGYTLHYASNVLWTNLRPALKAWDEHGAPQEKHELALRLRGPFALLAGLAIENMLKGAIQQMTPRALRNLVIGHDLIKLAKRLDLPLSPAESDLLERLTRFVKWAGRYPVALDAAETSKPRLLRSSDYVAIVGFAGKLIRTYHHGHPPPKRAAASQP
jgi:hypothetical protein